MRSTKTATPTEDQEPQESELCISCLKPNTPGTHFCGHCGTPLTSYAATAPLESMLAEGDLWRKATTRGRWSGPARVFIMIFLVCLLLSFILGWLVPR